MKIPHPGTVLGARLDALGLSVSGAAHVLRVNRVTLSKMLNGRADLSADMAIRFAKAFGMPVAELMALQAAHDLALALRRFPKIRVPRYAAPTVTNKDQR
jgi:addiction module HigA family antidote